MRTLKYLTLSVSIAAGVAMIASADSAPSQNGGVTQVAALSSGNAPTAMTLPDVTVIAPKIPSYTGRFGARPGSAHTVRATHFHVYAGYDANKSLHPYTSNMGPCPEGTTGAGCDRPFGKVIQPSHYERSPFTN